MPAFMLHFSCTPAQGENETQKCTAESCIIATELAEAEALARELIANHHYYAEELIAFSEVNEEKLAALSELETTLYLKTQTNSECRSVLFSQWNEN